jgi:hypothetical protein
MKTWRLLLACIVLCCSLLASSAPAAPLGASSPSARKQLSSNGNGVLARTVTKQLQLNGWLDSSDPVKATPLGQTITSIVIDGPPSEEFITGTIPTAIGEWTALKFLTFQALGQVSFTDSIPAEISEMTNLLGLTIIDLFCISGTLPAEISVLTKMTRISIVGAEEMTGERIPAAILELTNLKSLVIVNNPKKSGTIPPQISDLAALEVLRLGGENNDIGVLGFGGGGPFPGKFNHARSVLDKHCFARC